MNTATVNQKRTASAKILANEGTAEGFCRMTVELPQAEKDFTAGQFFQLRIHPEGLDPLLRRPFAPSELTAETMSFVYAVVGKGTSAMSRLTPGDKVDILYPLGRAYTLPKEEKARAILVGGGCGAPSMLVLARKLKEMGHEVEIVLGARSRCTLLEANAMKDAADRLVITTDDGSEGIHGHAVDGVEWLLDDLDNKLPAYFYACGPELMLKGLAALAEARNIPCEVSLEERMACGFGACVGCVVKAKDDSRPEGFVYKKVCKDGPVFDARELVWE